MKYSIAGINIELDLPYHPEPCWQAFQKQDDTREPCMICSRLSFQMINRDLSVAEFGDAKKIFMSGCSFAISDETFRHSYLSFSDKKELSLLLAYLFCTHAIRKGMLKVHCSIIEDQGRGILFLGPSGIGKTTQAERWAQYRGASIVNGDVGFVQQTSEGYVAWGTPWHGSSSYCKNEAVPIKALIVLKQASVNRLHLLTGFEKVAEVSGSILHPTWLEKGVEQCADLFHALMKDLPVYRLDNRADEEAVRLLAKEIDSMKY